MNTQILTFTILAFTGLAAIAHAETRIFTDDKGRTLDGELVSVAGDMVTIKRAADGQLLTTEVTKFCQADQVYFAIKGRAAPPATFAPPPVPVTDKPAAGSGGLGASAGTAPLNIEVKISPVKKQVKPVASSDEVIQRISCHAEICNRERQRALTGAKVILLAFAKDLRDRSESIVISREEFDISLEPLATTSCDTKDVKLSFYDGGFKYGNQYSGHILVLKDSGGKIISVKASSETMAKFAEDVLKLKVKDVVDKNYKFIKEGYLR